MKERMYDYVSYRFRLCDATRKGSSHYQPVRSLLYENVTPMERKIFTTQTRYSCDQELHMITNFRSRRTRFRVTAVRHLS